MTLKEVALTLGKSESTIARNFARTQANLRKKGILLMKWGEGKNAEYEIEYEALDALENKEEEK
jgi:hypothetical protein